MQNLPRETGWHLRGTRRIGVSFEDVEVVQQCVSLSRVLFYTRIHLRWEDFGFGLGWMGSFGADI
jgi:hypothetical protein